MQTIYLDISNKGVIPTIHAKQGDVGRKFQVVLTDSGLPYIPVGGSAFSVWYSGASGEGNYTEVGDKSAFSVSGNKVTVEMISQMLSNDGEGVLSFVLNDPNGNQISTWNIHYICEYVPGADSQEAKAYYTAFSHAVEKLPYPDASLSVSGKAADAAATGKALAGKAPAGYGLGEVSNMQTLVNLGGINDVATKPGWYKVAFSLNSISNWTLRVDTDGANIFQEYKAVYNGNELIMHRACTDGAWGEFEWVNPPMIPGVEYRTAERWNGRVVYAKCVDCGELVPGSATAVYPNIGMPIRWSGRTEGGTALPFVPYVNDRSTDITIGVQPGTIFISAGSARAAEKVYVSVRYAQ